MKDLELVRLVSEKLYERKADDIVVLKVDHLTVLCDYMIIASGRTTAQIDSLADSVEEVMASQGVSLRRSEGVREGRWAILDYGHIIIHLFHRDERAYYDLERLWTDGQNKLDLIPSVSAD